MVTGKARSLTDGQRRYLTSLARGEPVNDRCRTQSDYGGLATIAYSLSRRGFVRLVGNDAPALTDEGLRALLSTVKA